MRKPLDFLKPFDYILNYIAILLKLFEKGIKMDQKFITKPILRETEPMIDHLRKAYSQKLGVSVKQGEAISLAIKNEYKRNVKTDKEAVG